MKKKFFAFVAMITAAFSLSSCLNSDDTTAEYTHDTAITAFSLGSLDRWSKTTAGKDTLLKANVTGSNYKFYIDQTLRKIYNPDSLPCGARDTAILATITSKESSPIVLMHIDKTDSIAAYYSSSDSINFSKPRYIRVYNNDYSAYVEYEVKVNVHQEEADVFNWKSLASANAALRSLSDLKVVAAGGYIYAFGKVDGSLKIYKTSNTDGANWTAVEPNQTFDAEDYQNVVVMNGNIYLLSSGKVYTSADAATWTVVAENANVKQLIGASSKYLYAYTGETVAPTTIDENAESCVEITGILVSKDNGVTWTSETMDASATLLPTHNLSMNVAAIRSTKNAENVMLMGTRPENGDTIATTWTHMVDYSSNAPVSAWNYLELDKNQPNKMPMMDEVLVCTADTGFVALGSNGKWYKSKDAGLNWEVDTLVTLPAGFLGSLRFGFCRDENNYYWVINGGQVWKGRFNKDGWRKEQTIYQ